MTEFQKGDAVHVNFNYLPAHDYNWTRQYVQPTTIGFVTSVNPTTGRYRVHFPELLEDGQYLEYPEPALFPAGKLFTYEIY